MTVARPYADALVGVLLGGLSSERSVSLTTGARVADALERCGYRVARIDVGADLPEVLRATGVQVCFNALHGTYGEDGCVQGLLELLRIPYTGSGPGASALAMDKLRSKRLFEHAGLPTPEFLYFAPGEAPGALVPPWELPVVVKPNAEGSSVGVTIVLTVAELPDALAQAAACGDGGVLVERYVPGQEVTVGVLDGHALGTTEIEPAAGFYDFHNKYQSEQTRYHSPARVDAALQRRLYADAERAVAVLGCAGAPRVDFRVDPAGAPWLLEVNTLPGMTDHSLLPMCAAQQGVTYDELCDRILGLAQLWVGGGR